MEFKFLNEIGMGHLTQLIATGKLPPILQLIFICYQDEPEVSPHVCNVSSLSYIQTLV